MRTLLSAVFWNRLHRVRAVHFVLAGLCFALMSSLSADRAGAQNLSPDELQQLLQQRQNGSGGITGQQSILPQQTILEPAAAPAQSLPTSRLEQIMSQRAGMELKQFGYDQLGIGRSVSVPQMGGVQDDYVLGPGDEIAVALRGQENSQYNTLVDRDGRVLLPKLPPISASGRTFGDFRQDILAAIHRAYISTEGYVSIGRVRQVSVLVAGEVNNPGTRIVTGLSTPADAILISGGVKKTGSLRAVKLVRNGRETTVDLYNIVTQHGAANEFLLGDGDRIIVPPLGPTVAITGWVRRPGIYEMSPGGSAMSARALLSLAGGLEVRGKYRISVLGVAGNGQAVMAPAQEGTLLHDSDVLYVQPAAEQTTSQATLSGGIALAGRYPITQGTMLSEIVKAPGALGPSPYTLLGVISRRDPKTYLRELIAFSPVAVLNGTADMPLQTDDVVRVFSMNESQMMQTAIDRYGQFTRALEEAARNPESSIFGQQNPIFDFDNPNNNAIATSNQQGQVAFAGGQQGIGTAAGANSINPVETSALNSAQTLAGSSGNAQAAINSLVSQNQGQNQGLTPAGTMPMPGVSRNFQTEALTSGAVATNQEATTFGQAAAQLGVTPLVLANFLSDRTVRIDGAVRGPGMYLVGPDVSLADVVQAAGGTLQWADNSGVELTTTKVDRDTGKAVTSRASLPLKQGMLANYLVQPQDEFRFRKVFTDVDAGTVVVQGQLRFPGTYRVSRGEHLSDLLVRAGGMTDVAYPYGTVFLRRSAAAIERTGYKRSADEIENQLIVAMSRRSEEKLSPDAFVAMQGFVKELRNTTPLGRVSVAADPSLLLAKPSLDLLLEPGDVIYIPQRPSTIAILGQVLQPGSVPFHAGMSVEDYIRQAGGYAQFADESQTFIILPDGTARKYESSWLNFDEPSIPPGSSIVVPRDLSPLDLHQLVLDTTQILSQLAVSTASLAVLATRTAN